MTNFPINIQLNVSGQGRLQEIARSVQLIRQETVTARTGIVNMVSALAHVNGSGFRSIESAMKGLNSSLKEIDASTKGTKSGLDSINKSLNSFKGNGLKTITNELKTMSKESTQLSSNIAKIDFKKLNGSVATLKSIDSTLKQLLSTVERLKSNGNIQLNVTTNAGQVQSQLQGLNTRPHTYRTGSRNGINYYGWGADYDPMYQRAAPVTQVGRNMQRIGEKVGLIGGNLMMASSFLGVKELSDTIIQTPAKAEVQKYLLSNMQGGASIQKEGGGGATTLYKTLDATTDELPISMQNVVQPLYAFKAASGATAQELNNIIPEFANFGAQVINMTGSEEQAEEAMQKLSRAYQGQYAAVDQYGITKESLAKVGYEEGGTIEEFMDAVTKITGNAKDSMNNFNGMKALVGKDFSRAGKRIWEDGVGQIMTGIVSSFDAVDKATGGFSTQLLVATGGLLDLATSATVIIGSLGTTIGTFGQMWGNLKAIRQNGGGLGSAVKGIFSGVNSAGIYGATAASVGGEIIDNSAMQASVYAGALEGTSAGMASNAVLGKKGIGGTTTSTGGSGGSGGKTAPVVFGKTKPKPTVVTKPSTKMNSFERRALENKRYNQRQQINSVMHPNYVGTSRGNARELGAMAAKSDSFTNQLRRNNQIITKTPDVKGTIQPGRLGWYGKYISNTDAYAKASRVTAKTMPYVNKGLGKMASLLGFLASPTGVLVGLGGAALIAKGALDTAAAHNDKAKDARTNLYRSFGNLGNRLSSIAGDFLHSIGVTSSKGTEGLYDGIANIANDTARLVNLVSGHTPEEDEYRKLQEEDMDNPQDGQKSRYHKQTANADYEYHEDTKSYEPTTPYEETKQEAWHTAEWRGNIAKVAGQAMDWIGSQIGQDWDFTGMARSATTQEETKIQQGDPDAIRRQQEGTIFPGPIGVAQLFSRRLIGNDLVNMVPGSGHEKEGLDSFNWKKNAMSFLTPKLSRDNLNFLHGGLFGGNPFYTEQTHGSTVPVSIEDTNASAGKNLFPWLSNFNFGDLFGNKPKQDSKTTSTQPQQQQNQQKDSGVNIPYLSKDMEQSGLSKNIHPILDANSIVSDIQQKLGTIDFSSLQTNFSSVFSNMFSGNGGIDLTSKGMEWANQLTGGFNTGFDTSQLNIGNVEGAITQHNPEARSGGSSLGKAGHNGFNSGFGDLSGIVSAECAEIEKAIRDAIPAVSAAASALGAAMMLANTGPDSPRHESPGRLAIAMSEEGDEIAKAFYRKVTTVGNAAGALGANIVSSFEPYSRISGYVSSNLSSTSNSGGVTVNEESSSSNRNVVINNNFHIDKIDSKDRVREIAETLVHIMTFNNETAGRNTDVGL